MDTAQWQQEIEPGKTMEEMGSSSCLRPPVEKKARPQKDQALNCPRCNSTNTKFCYYNNYSLTQPRYFCKTCRRYWTEGGSLRNVPVGGGSRKNKRATATSCASASASASAATAAAVSSSCPRNIPDFSALSSSHPPSQNPKDVPDCHDLNLSFQPTRDYRNIPEFLELHTTENTNCPSTSSPTSTSLPGFELFRTGIAPRGLGSLMPFPVPGADSHTMYPSGLGLHDFGTSLSFPVEGMGVDYGCIHGVHQQARGRLLFPFEDLKPVNDYEQQNRVQGEPSGYWNGVLGGGPW